MTSAATTGKMMTKEEFQVAASARFEKVLKKLNSATVSRGPIGIRFVCMSVCLFILWF